MKKGKKYKITKEKVWLWPGETAVWHFVYVDKKSSEDIRKKHNKSKRGFGSLQVIATIGKTKWKTSIFPQKKEGTYILPLKLEVRRKEDISEGDVLTYIIEII
jgi:hypothetical protein